MSIKKTTYMFDQRQNLMIAMTGVLSGILGCLISIAVSLIKLT